MQRDDTTEMLDTLFDVQHVMSLLTERQREALTLWSQGYTQKEIAERLVRDQSTVCREIQRAADLVRWLCA